MIKGTAGRRHMRAYTKQFEFFPMYKVIEKLKSDYPSILTTYENVFNLLKFV